MGMALNSNQGFSFETSADAVATDLMAESLGVIVVSICTSAWGSLSWERRRQSALLI